MAKYFLPTKIKSQNEFQYSGWKKYYSYKKVWFTAIGFLIGKGEHDNQKKRIKITSFRKKLLDEGNLIGGAKPIPDALKEFGWIVDDSVEWVEIEYEQNVVKCRKELGTLIEIEDRG